MAKNIKRVGTLNKEITIANTKNTSKKPVNKKASVTPCAKKYKILFIRY